MRSKIEAVGIKSYSSFKISRRKFSFKFRMIRSGF